MAGSGRIEHRNVEIEFAPNLNPNTRLVLLPLTTLDARHADAQLFQQIGVIGSYSRAQLGPLAPDGAAAASKLKAGDVVLRVGTIDIVDAPQLRELIRSSGRLGEPRQQTWLMIEMANVLKSLSPPNWCMMVISPLVGSGLLSGHLRHDTGSIWLHRRDFAGD